MATAQGYFDASFMQPGMVKLWLHAVTAFGVPIILLRHSNAGFLSASTPLTTLICAAWTRGERVVADAT